MKKILTICIFAFALLISSQGFAQLKSTINVENSTVKQDIKNVIAALGLNSEQANAISKLYIKKEKMLNPSDASAKTIDKIKVDEKFTKAMKRILTDQQFAKFKSMR